MKRKICLADPLSRAVQAVSVNEVIRMFDLHINIFLWFFFLSQTLICRKYRRLHLDQTSDDVLACGAPHSRVYGTKNKHKPPYHVLVPHVLKKKKKFETSITSSSDKYFLPQKIHFLNRECGTSLCIRSTILHSRLFQQKRRVLVSMENLRFVRLFS